MAVEKNIYHIILLMKPLNEEITPLNGLIREKMPDKSSIFHLYSISMHSGIIAIPEVKSTRILSISTYNIFFTLTN